MHLDGANSRGIPVLSLFRDRGFLIYFLGQIFSRPAWHLLNFSLLIQIFELTHSTLSVSLYILLVSLPPIFFAPLGGVVTDTINRKTLLVAGNILRALLATILFLIPTNVPLLFLFAFILSIIAQFLGPAETSAIPELIPSSHLFLANSFSSFLNYGSFLVGYAAAGPLLLHFGHPAVWTIIFFFFLFSGLLNLLLPPLKQHLQEAQPLSHVSRGYLLFFHDRIRETIAFLRLHPVLLLVMVQIAYIFSLERSVATMIPAFATELLGFTIQDLSFYLILPTAIGAIIGTFGANLVKHRYSERSLIHTGLFLNAVGLLLLSLYPSLRHSLPVFLETNLANSFLLVFLILTVLLSGVADPLEIIPAQTLLHRHAPLATHGRIFGTLTMMMNLAGLLPILAIGLLTQVVALTSILFALGLITLAVIVFSILRYPNRQNSFQ